MITYKTKKELAECIVCLYDSHAQDPFSSESLVNYINACSWQLSQGITPRRIPFFVSAIPSECEKAIDKMIFDRQAKRKADNHG